MRVVIVGPCASGKSVLVEGLTRLGYDAQACAQEHSYLPTMWQMDQPDLLPRIQQALVVFLGLDRAKKVARQITMMNI